MQLLKEVKTYRFENEPASDEFIQKEKDNACGYEIKKVVSQLKTKKSKGEIVDSWVQTEITYNYDLEA
jgi:hypothetical protein